MKKYFDENGNEIFVFEKGEKHDKAMFPRPHPVPGPRGRFPWWSIYTPVVPCIYDGNITLLEQISKLYYYANKLNDAINQNHDDIITLGERVDGMDVELARILELIGDLPKFVHVEFDTASTPITADRTFEDLKEEYKAGSILVAHTTADKAFYVATYGDDGNIVFLAQQSTGNVAIVMTPDEITQSLTRYITSAGGTILGTLNILNAPASPLNAANKAYVDAAIGDIDLSDYLPLAGGTMTGQIIQPANPTENRSLVNKRYVDLTVGESTRYAVGAETKIGEWVENDMVYDVFRKVVDFGALPNASQKSIAHEIENFTRFISIRALATSSSNSLEIPMASADGTNNIYLSAGNARVSIQTNSDQSAFTICYVELKFIRPQQAPTNDIDG